MPGLREAGGEAGKVLPAAPGDRDLDRLLRLFIRIRWLFAAGLAAAILAGSGLFRAAFPVRATMGVGAAILAYNALFWAHRRLRRPGTPPLRQSEIEALLQIGLDLVALTAIVHLTGGAESPFIVLYLIHSIAGSMLLPRRLAWLVGAGAVALILLAAVAAHEVVLPAYLPAAAGVSRLQQRSLRIALALAFLVAIVAAMSITAWIMARLRRRERDLMATQEALLRKSQDLEEAMASLTEKQQQLVATEKQASLGRLVAGIAHEINNPIQFIHGNMAVLSEAFGDLLPILDQEVATHPDLRVARLDYPFFRKQVPVMLQDMADGAARIGSIVSDLRTFARRDEGRLDEAVDLGEVVRASVRLLHNRLKRVAVEEEIDPDLPQVRGNLTQLQQVVVNLLQNAHQALGSGPGGRIAIRVRTEPGEALVRLSVEDNGCGIPPHLQRRIFDPFFTTRGRQGGTGLGLAITEEIVQEHQGRIELESQVGVGTTFHLLLPTRSAP